MKGQEDRQGLSYQVIRRLGRAGWKGEGSYLGQREGLGRIQEVGDRRVVCKEVGQE